MMMAIEKKPIGGMDNYLSRDLYREYLERLVKNKIPPEEISTNKSLLENNNSTNTTAIDVVLVCALTEERDRAFDAFSVPDENRRRMLQDYRVDYNFVYHRFSYADLNIAVITQSHMGMATATSLASRAILAMKPKLVAMTGICAGRKGKVSLGDIIIAEQVFDYTAGKKYVDRFAPRPMSFPLDEDTRNVVAAKVENNDRVAESIMHEWKGTRIPRRISVHMKTLASGTAVIDDNDTMASAAGIQDSLFAIDMESYGIALAAHALRTNWIVIKAVQDYADGNKDEDENGIRDFASFASANLFKLLITDLVK